MTFYTGNTADGSDMKEVQGVFVSPSGNEWCSEPYPHQKEAQRLKAAVLLYMNGRYSLNDVYKQIKDKTCSLGLNARNYVLAHYDENGNFKNKS